MTGTYLDSPSGQPILEVTRSGDMMTAVLTFRGERLPGQCVKAREQAITKFFGAGKPPEHFDALFSREIGFYLVMADEGTNLMEHRMATKYCVWTLGGFVDLYKQ